eukprot:2829327-Pyramimonas_sp.AAC.1
MQFWDPLGPLLERSWALLGPYWGDRGPILGHIGAILRPQEPFGGEKAISKKTLIVRRCLKEFGLLG